MRFKQFSAIVFLLCLFSLAQSATNSSFKDARPAIAEPIFSEFSSLRSAIPDKLNDPAISRQNMTISTASIADAFQSGADRLVAVQNTDGGWGWPLTGTSALNTIGPIGKGLAQAYLQTNDADHRAALVKVGDLLRTKVGNFSPSDGYLAASLDAVLGVTTYTSYVKANLYDLLKTGSYYRSTDPTGPFDTAGYINRIRTGRSGTQANMAAWDVGMGLVGAASCGVTDPDLELWIQGVKDEINELDGANYYDVIGLAGAVYGLAFVDEDFDPTAGEHILASSLSDLAAILASYQIAGGGFAWNSRYVIPNDGNETIQETAYAVLALAEFNHVTYFNKIAGAGYYIRSVQLTSGGWENYNGNGENNELTGEALWGMSESFPVYNVNKLTYHPTIQDGIDNANSGNTLKVAAGTHTEGAQVVIDRNLTVQGAGKTQTTIKPEFNTGNSGDLRGWFLVNAGITFNLSDLTLDGTDHLIFMGILHKGNGTVDNCKFKNIQYNASGPDYQGIGMSVRETSGIRVDVTNCSFEGIGRIGIHYRGPGITGTFSGNDYTGKGPGTWLDYGVEAGGAPLPEGGANITITNNTIRNCQGVASDLSTSAGVLVTTYFGPGTKATILNCKINNCTDGIAVGYNGLDVSQVVANYNDLSGNTHGVNSTAPTVDASGNWWGDTDPSDNFVGSVDYTPWVKVGTDINTDPGFQPNLSYLYVSAACPQVPPTLGRIHEGIDMVSGSTVEVLAGTYAEHVNLNKSLTLKGISTPVVDGSGSGDCITIAADAVTIDGFAVTNGINGIKGKTSNSKINNNIVYGNSQAGILLGSDVPVSQNNRLQSNTIHDNGTYGLQLWNADYSQILGNTIYNHNTAGSGYGVYLLSSRYNTVSSNTINANQYNVVIYNDGGPLAGKRSAAGNKVQANTLKDPGIWSVRTKSDANTSYVNFNVFSPGGTPTDKYVANDAAATLNAKNNWLGGENPPQPTDFLGNVTYIPFFATDMTVAVSPDVYYMPEGGEANVEVMALVPEGKYVRGTDVTLTWSNDANIPDQSGPECGEFFTAKMALDQNEFFDFNPDPVASNVVTVNQGLFGGSTGAGNASNPPYIGVLFRMNYAGNAAGTSNLTLSDVKVRNVSNSDIAPLVIQNGQLIVDATAPSVTSVVIDNTTLNTDQNGDSQDDYVKDVDNVTITATVTDDNPLTRTDIFANLSGFYNNVGHTADNPSSYDTGTKVATWTVTGVDCYPVNGTITLNVLATDVAGNEGTGNDAITADNIAPTNVNTFKAFVTATSGHQKVNLTWNNSWGADATYKGVMVRYDGGGSYPTYATLGSYPAGISGGDGEACNVTTGASGTHSIVLRDIYYYSAFAYDWAGNYSAVDAGGQDRSTNYFLGDLGSGTGYGGGAYDGLINIDDLLRFSDAYWSIGSGLPRAESNIGPTDFNKSYSVGNAFAIPKPDTKGVEFEDMMIFAMNYGQVHWKLNTEPGKTADHFALELKGQTVEDQENPELIVRVHLANDGRDVKGASIKVTFDAECLKLISIEKGRLFGMGEQTTFFMSRSGENWLQFDASILGTGAAVDYSGDLAVLRFAVEQVKDAQIDIDSYILRDAENVALNAQVSGMSVSDAMLPTTYDMVQNYPNPFNPETTIQYQVPEACHVELVVYNAAGQQVTTLVSELKEPGRYKVIWNGRDFGDRPVSSGLYYYRIKAGDYNKLLKMVFLK